MKNMLIKVSVVLLMVISTSFKSKTSTGYVTLEVSYVTVMGGHASVLNTDTNVTYDLVAVDTYAQVEVPYGNYVLTSASTNSCSSPLIGNVTTSTGYDTFTIDGGSQNFTIYASCY